MENLVRKDRILKYIFMIPIAVLFCMVAALFIHGFFSYTDADYVDRFAGVFEKIFLMAGMVTFCIWVFHLFFFCLFVLYPWSYTVSFIG